MSTSVVTVGSVVVHVIRSGDVDNAGEVIVVDGAVVVVRNCDTEKNDFFLFQFYLIFFYI